MYSFFFFLLYFALQYCIGFAIHCEGEGGTIWENGIETCILSCKKRITSLCSIQDTGCLGLVHGMIQRDDTGREVGGGFMFGNACKN